jgi:hypothetical protein
MKEEEEEEEEEEKEEEDAKSAFLPLQNQGKLTNQVFQTLI